MVRSNGRILLTLLTSPDLFQVEPFRPGRTPKLIHTFAGYLGLLGITEIEPDTFAVASDNFSATDLTTSKGSYAVWKVNVRKSPPVVKKITDISEAQLLNGLTLLDADKKTILMADSTGGVLFRLNTETGKYIVVIDDPILKGTPGGPVPVDVNGVRVVNGTLFFTNLNQNIFASVPITRHGTATGPFKTIVHNAVGSFDDFALSPEWRCIHLPRAGKSNRQGDSAWDRDRGRRRTGFYGYSGADCCGIWKDHQGSEGALCGNEWRISRASQRDGCGGR